MDKKYETIIFGDLESEIEELQAELHYYAKQATKCREEARKLILEAIRCEVSAENRQRTIKQLLGNICKKP